MVNIDSKLLIAIRYKGRYSKKWMRTRKKESILVVKSVKDEGVRIMMKILKRLLENKNKAMNLHFNLLPLKKNLFQQVLKILFLCFFFLFISFIDLMIDFIQRHKIKKDGQQKFT